jgi:cellulose biosynthesis protein BcsQ
MKGLAIVSTKGGVGKTSISHLIALGAAWRNTPAYLMHTDEREPIRVQGRPYMYYDARDPETLSRLICAAVNQDGLCIIDSGGNRPEFDQWIASAVDIVLIPVTPDPEAVDMALEHMARLETYGAENVRFLLNMVSSNRNERLRDHSEYFSRLPKDKIIGQVSKVSAVKRLRENDKANFETPPTNVNNLSRRLFVTIKNALESVENEEEQLETA